MTSTPTPTGAAGGDGAAPGRKPHGAWGENVETVVMAVVMAILLKYFIIEAYKIPTGSMQPTLIGDERSGIQDRILVDKLSYRFRAPERWEVCVFRYPLDRSKTFVKRIAGIGPEELKIEYGDLWHRTPDEPWSILRRPRSVQRSAWKRIDDDPDREPPVWEALTQRPGSAWTVDGARIEAKGPGTARFRSRAPSVTDGYLDGYPRAVAELVSASGKRSGNNTVGDLRVEGRVDVVSGTRAVAVVLKEGKRNYRFLLPGPAAPEGTGARIDAGPYGAEEGGEGAANASVRLRAGEPVAFAAQNMDDLLELEVAGEVVCSLEIDPAVVQSSSLYLEVEGDGATFEELRVYRDIFYTSNGTRGIEIPEGHYFMLGDNTQESSDSREWRDSVLSLEAGVQHRGNLRRGENPRLVGIGEPGGPITYFVDEWGEPHWLKNADILSRRATPAPFVPRDMIQGKAVAVFWPLDPRRDIFRLRWVN